MKKICILSMALIVMSNIKSQNPNDLPYISDLFEQIVSHQIQTQFASTDRDNIHATDNNTLFVIKQKGFQNQTPAGYAKIFKINLFTGAEEIYQISPPPYFLKKGGNFNRLWIWALAASNTLLFVAVDEEIWVYQYNHEKQYEYITTISIKLVSKLFVVDNELHAFADHAKGFDWTKINLSNYEIQNVRDLVLENSFFMQIYPMQVIAMQNNALYLLQQNEPAIEKYTLSGKLLAKYSFQIPNWNKIPDEITYKLDSIKNITERNYAFPKYGIFNYNMMHLFYVFSNERFFMIAIDKNETAGTFITPYFIQIIGDKTIIEPYSINLQETEKFGEKYFPFLPAKSDGNMIFAQLNEYITQINQSTTVSWQGKTQKEFQQAVNLYHRDNEPVEKIETYRYTKNYIPADSVIFLDYDDQNFSLNDIKNDKAIFLISQYPQCTACIKRLWNYFSHHKSSNVDFFNVSQDCPTYLLKKERIKEINTFFTAEYTPLFIPKKEITTALQYVLTQKANPLVLLFDKKLQHIEVISGEHIIGDFTGNLHPSFLKRIENFIAP